MTFSRFTGDGLIFSLDVCSQFFKQLELHLNSNNSDYESNIWHMHASLVHNMTTNIYIP